MDLEYAKAITRVEDKTECDSVSLLFALCCFPLVAPLQQQLIFSQLCAKEQNAMKSQSGAGITTVHAC